MCTDLATGVKISLFPTADNCEFLNHFKKKLDETINFLSHLSYNK